MTRTPDAQVVNDLIDTFRPARPGVISPDEIKLVRDKLELDARTDIELQNARDMTVLLYGQAAQKCGAAGQLPLDVMDRMSAVVGVIDEEKSKRGLPV